MMRGKVLPTLVLALAIAAPVSYALASSPTPDVAKPGDAAATANPESGLDGTIVPSDALLSWQDEQECLSCHEREAKTFEDESCLISLHGKMTDCVDCHTDDALIGMHDGKSSGDKTPKKLKKTDANVTVCLTCHDMEKVAEKTAESKALVDEKGTQVNPHSLPTVTEHGEIVCTTCHKVHKDDDTSKTAAVTCLGCHHENVYECGTCHAK